MNNDDKRLLKLMIDSLKLEIEKKLIRDAHNKEKELASQQVYRANLLSSISHDFRTPLSGIMGSIEMLLNLQDVGGRQYLLTKELQEEVSWLHDLVENILSLTKLQDGKIVLKKELEIAEEVIGSAISRFQNRNIEHSINVNIPNDPVFIEMDAQLIEQVLINLIDNSIKFSEANSEIRISVNVNESDNYVEFIIEDHGIGIEEEDLSKVFEMYYTSTSKFQNSKRGLGLGLPICKSIIEAHNGIISVANASKYPGTIVKFSLPYRGELQ